ncbi:MAG: SGNH/GDSL hydrolase family protein [Planctomycetes bacterium]|nr:SGNH/GDSL hydrolase family protein [Planctomycetota bacterium]
MTSEPPQEPRPPLPVAQRLGYATLTLVLFALLLEGAPALGGIGDPRRRLSPTRGFSPSVSYLVPDPDRPGHVRTQMYDGESPELLIPPRSGKVRVLLFGGSNTEGFPVDRIEGPLQQALPGPGVEVFNLGRRGYGSERVRILFTQALALEPDVVPIYMGHNEFIAQGFAAGLAGRWSRPWLLELTDRLSALHTLNAAVDLASRLSARDTATAPEPWRERDPASAFASFTWERTQLFYGVYEENPRAMVSLARDAGARVVLSTLVGNDFGPPFVSTLQPGLPEEAAQLIRRKRQQAAHLIPLRLRRGLVQSGPDDPVLHLRPTDWGESVTPEQLATRRARVTLPPAPPLRDHAGSSRPNAARWSRPRRCSRRC